MIAWGCTPMLPKLEVTIQSRRLLEACFDVDVGASRHGGQRRLGYHGILVTVESVCALTMGAYDEARRIRSLQVPYGKPRVALHDHLENSGRGPNSTSHYPIREGLVRKNSVDCRK